MFKPTGLRLKQESAGRQYLKSQSVLLKMTHNHFFILLEIKLESTTSSYQQQLSNVLFGPELALLSFKFTVDEGTDSLDDFAVKRNSIFIKNTKLPYRNK